ncbi:FixH family protein [Mucilaginibacter ginkgonis]|uniref:FixH family protein n=1 Tax=Mucilaginibacter ginkgonis TaxID=2682091 RepID=A0A6I4IMQ5_9SPHI|nr:FixH family protein [Mucilaginibacter ginkgonis]QQL50249.1 FixH family protein [Mucilaginibacter ginkgonis]
MNWGKGIILGMGLFMLFILVLCFKMFRLPVDEYDHHYYEKGLNFNKDYDKEKQVTLDNAQPWISLSGTNLQLKFKDEANGTAKLVRPASATLDRLFIVNTDKKGLIDLPLTNLVKGRWRVVLEWKSNHKNYLYEKEVNL